MYRDMAVFVRKYHSWKQLCKPLYVMTLLVSDGFLTYRLFVVWNRVWWITILPVLLLIATASECVHCFASGSALIRLYS